MFNRSFLVGAGVGGAGLAHQWWRLRATSAPYGPFGSMQVEMRAAIGGADQCNGGTAIASSYAGTNYPAYAFDNVLNIAWYSQNAGPGEWIGYAFPAPVVVKEIVLLDNLVNMWPVVGVAVDFSDDGNLWTQLLVIDPITHLPQPEPLFGSGHNYMLIQLP